MNVFHKTEVQRSFRGAEQVLNLIGSKVMTQMQKNAKTEKNAKNGKTNITQTKMKKKTEREIFVFCVITFEPIKI